MIELEKRRVRTSAGELAYVEAGDPEAPPVVFLHGLVTSSYLWRHFVPLVSPWMRAIAPDLLGAGDSDKPAGAALNLPAQAGYVRELLDTLDVAEFAVVGHAFGGGIAQRLALEGGVRAMVLIDSVAFDAWPSDVVRELQGNLSGLSEELVRAWVGIAFDLGMRHRSRLSDEDLAEFRRPFAGPEGAEAFARLVVAMDGAGLADAGPSLATLEVPTLVLWGEDDAFLPPELAERLGDALPMASVGLLPGCGHFLTEDALETVAPLVLQYLRSRYLGEEHRHEAGRPVRVELRRSPPTEGR